MGIEGCRWQSGGDRGPWRGAKGLTTKLTKTTKASRTPGRIILGGGQGSLGDTIHNSYAHSARPSVRIAPERQSMGVSGTQYITVTAHTGRPSVHIVPERQSMSSYALCPRISAHSGRPSVHIVPERQSMSSYVLCPRISPYLPVDEQLCIVSTYLPYLPVMYCVPVSQLCIVSPYLPRAVSPPPYLPRISRISGNRPCRGLSC